MLTLIGLALILVAWTWQFMAMLRGIDAASRAPSSIFVGLYIVGTGFLVYDALSSHFYLLGYMNLAVLLPALAVFVMTFKR